MCIISVYEDKISEETKICEDVAEYKIDLNEKKLWTQSILGEEKTFDLKNNLKWSEESDTLII